nr:mechanosensitive ion channel domain-containing protein [Sediminitomix flava]
MELYQINILKTISVFILYLLVKNICYKLINQTLNNKQLLKFRGELIKRVVNIIFISISLIMISVIWGVDQSELVVFLGSVLTIIGVAFFAQWSLLSNITSSIILFFSHPIRLNDSITILEGKEYELEGKVIDIGLFFVTVLTDEGDEIILPNNIFIQKSIKKRKV